MVPLEFPTKPSHGNYFYNGVGLIFSYYFFPVIVTNISIIKCVIVTTKHEGKACARSRPVSPMVIYT